MTPRRPPVTFWTWPRTTARRCGIRENGAARAPGRGAEEARTQVARARNAARTAGAQRLASGSYSSAVSAERDAERLYAAGRLGDATDKFHEASGLYRSAEIAAQNETTRRDAAARMKSLSPEPVAVEAGRNTALPPPPAASSPVTPPSTPPLVESGGPPATPLPAPPTTPTTTVPPTTTVAPAPAAPPPQPSAEALAAARDAAITDLLGRYKAAIEGRNLDAVKRIWPGISTREQDALRDEFRRATQHQRRHRQYRESPPRPTRVRSRSSVTTKSWPRDRICRSQSNATMEVRRSGASWIIERIRFELRR